MCKHLIVRTIIITTMTRIIRKITWYDDVSEKLKMRNLQPETEDLRPDLLASGRVSVLVELV